MKRKTKDVNKEEEEWFENLIEKIREDLDKEVEKKPFDSDETLGLIREYESRHGKMYKSIHDMSAVPFRLRRREYVWSFCLSLLLFLLVSTPIMSQIFSHTPMGCFATNYGADYKLIEERIYQTITR